MELKTKRLVIRRGKAKNTASCRVAEKAGFELFEKRTPISHKQPNMVSDSYFYFRKYRP